MTGRALIAALLSLQVLVASAAHAGAVGLAVRGDRLFLPVEVNGQKTEALLDSAAESSLIDPSFASELKLRVSGQATARGSGGQQQVQFAQVSVRAASVSMSHLTVAVVDFTDVSRRLVGSRVQFILGRELFDAARLRIDIDAGSIQAVSRSLPVSGMALTLTGHAGIESIPARVEGIAAAADVDLGNGSDVLIGRGFAERHGLLGAGRIIAKRQGGGIGGEVEREVIRLGTLEVGGSTFTDVEAAVDPMDNAGDLNLGVRILRRFIIVTDFAQRRIWLTPRPSAAEHSLLQHQ
jgi:predicted aspartyl protease